MLHYELYLGESTTQCCKMITKTSRYGLISDSIFFGWEALIGGIAPSWGMVPSPPHPIHPHHAWGLEKPKDDVWEGPKRNDIIHETSLIECIFKHFKLHDYLFQEFVQKHC